MHHHVSAPRPITASVGCHKIIPEEEALADEEEDLYYRTTIDKIQFRSSHEVLQTTYGTHPHRYLLLLAISEVRSLYSKRKWSQIFPILTLL